MAKFIEITGTAGVGKTTLYKALASLHEKRYDWLPAHKLYPEKHSHANSLTKLAKKLKKLVINRQTGVAVDRHRLVEAGECFVEQHPLLMKLFWENIYLRQQTSLNGRDQRFEKATFLYGLIQKLQVVIESNTDKTALLDEGPSKMIDVLSNTAIPLIESISEIESAIRLLPMPVALIYLETEPHLNVKRLIERKHVIPAHKNLTFAQLENFVMESHKRKAMVNKFYYDHQIPILYLDGGADLESNVKKSMAFLAKSSCDLKGDHFTLKPFKSFA